MNWEREPKRPELTHHNKISASHCVRAEQSVILNVSGGGCKSLKTQFKNQCGLVIEDTVLVL